MSDSISMWRSKGYVVETFDNLMPGQTIPGAYGEQGYLQPVGLTSQMDTHG